MKIKWPLIYEKADKPLWYKVNTPYGMKFIMLVNMGDVLVSMPYFSYALIQNKVPDKVEVAPEFSYDGKIFLVPIPLFNGI